MPPPPPSSPAAASLPALAATATASVVVRQLPFRSFPRSPPSLGPRLHFGNLSSEAFQHGLHHRIALKPGAQFLCSRVRVAPRCCPCCNCFNLNTHAHGAAQHFARCGTHLLEGVSPLNH